ncbi:MAG: pentapeptide repeat-containing protein [Nitrospinota bacterium]|nr:pentapeptide repeat-containing protein [Nitrospinota bacterium]
MLIKQKSLFHLTFVTFLSLALANCSSGSSVEDTPTRTCSEIMDIAIHEHTLDGYPDLCARPEHVTVVELEHDAADYNKEDSGSTGVDVIPYKIETAGSYPFQFDDEENSPLYAVMKDSAGNQVFRIDANSGLIDVDLEAGNYNLFLYNQGSETVPIFIHAIVDGQITDSVRTDSQNIGGLAFSVNDIIRVTIERNCPKCDLTKAFLPFAWLYAVNLYNANLSGANLFRANLWDAVLSKANLTGANLSHAALWGTVLTEANLTDVNLTGADLTDANLSGATWTDGRKCAEGSIGKCK